MGIFYRNIGHPVKKLYTKLRYGVSCCDLDNYDQYLAKKLAHDLSLFKELSVGEFPLELSEKSWNKVLDEMIEGFELYDTSSPKQIKAIHLLAKYFQCLWY